MARLTVCLLGPFQVSLDGQPVTSFATDKVRALLAYLAVEAGLPHRREKLAGLLWPDQPESLARTNLRSTLARLRKAIRDDEVDPPLLLITPKALRLSPGADTWLDVIEFTALLQTLTEPPISRLEQAVALYRGPLLDGFSLPDSPLFEEWALFQRERYHRLMMGALHHLVEAYEARGEFDRALAHAWRQLELDPSWESAHRQAMRLLALSVTRDAALAQFETCRQRLAADLDVEPAPATVDLMRQIRDGELAARAPPVPARPRSSHNLLAPLTPFIGRESELAELGKLLQDPTCRLLTLVGPGGIGKTRLALEVARARLADYPDGVFHVALVGLSSTDSIVPTIAGVVGLRIGGDRDPLQQLTDYLRGRNTLLLLDNYEHLLEGAGLVVDLLRAAPGLKVLVTSRERLNVKGEHLLSVEGMAHPGAPGIDGARRGLGVPLAIRDLLAYDAVQLFVSGAQRACPAFDPAGHTLDVARICNSLEGLPLALLLASAWVRELSPAQIAKELSGDTGGSLDLLETEWRDVPLRHRGMRATFEHSWRLLDEGLRTTFAALTVFGGGFDAGAAEAVAGASLRDLRRLVDRFFVQRLPDGRYDVHELMRQCGAEKLAADPSAWEAAHDRHCAHYTAWLEAWDADLRGARQYEALAEMDVEIDNARAAWDWAVGHGDVHQVDKAADGLCRYYAWRAREDEYRSACRLAEDLLVHHVPAEGAFAADLVDAQRGQMCRVAAKVLGLSLHVCAEERRDSLYERALALLDRPELAGQDTRRERALILTKMAFRFSMVDPRRACCLEEESLSLYRALGERWETSRGLRRLAHVMLQQPAFAQETAPIWSKARPLLEESLSLSLELGAARSESLALLTLSTVAVLQGRKAESEWLLRRFLSVWCEAGYTESLSAELDAHTRIVEATGSFAESQAMIEQGVRLWSELGEHPAHFNPRFRLGEVLYLSGRYAEAQKESQIALSIARDEGRRHQAGRACLNLGAAALGQGRWEEAQQHFQQGGTIFQDLGVSNNLSIALAGLGVSALRLGDLPRSWHCLSEALTLSLQQGNLVGVAFELPTAALVLLESGELERAVEIYATVSKLPFVANSQYWEDIAGRHIAATAATLPPEVVAAARERGRARDLMETAREMLAELEAQIEETASAAEAAPSPGS